MSPTAVEMLDQPEATICPPKKFECCGQCSTKCKPLTKVSGFSFYVMQRMPEYGELGTRTAAEPTTACGGNREARLGPRSDFSRPRQGAVEKSVNATRQGGTPQIQLLGECLPGKLNPDYLPGFFTKRTRIFYLHLASRQKRRYNKTKHSRGRARWRNWKRS